MIDFVYGILYQKEEDSIVIESGGLGYKIFIPKNIDSKLPDVGEHCRIYTHLVHKEDVMELYGFTSEKERAIFRQLITVSGIGNKVAVKMLSTLTITDIIRAILNKNADSLTKVSGLGKKGAEKIILELQSKFKKLYPYPTEDSSDEEETIDRTAVDALMALGYKENKSIEMVSQVVKKGQYKTVDEVVTACLKLIAK